MNLCTNLIAILLCCFVNVNLSERLAQSDSDKIVELGPPTDVTLAYVGEKDAFIFWYAPQIFTVHNATVSPPNYFTRQCAALISATMANISVPNAKVLANATESGMLGNIDVSHHVLFNKTSSDTSKTDNKAGQSGYKHIGTTTHTELQEVIKSYIASKHVPMACADVKHYFIAWKKNGSDDVTIKVVDANVKEFNITGLEANTTYQFNVSAFYYTLTVMKSKTFNFTTGTNPSNINDCICNQTFSEHGCNMETKPCRCNQGYSGVFCELCAAGYYRRKPHLPCFSCPCDLLRSSGTCKMDEGYLYCNHCNVGYSGNTCSKCAFGYYRYMNACVRCKCNNNTDSCDRFTGRCLGCRYNTTGFSCHICMRGYIGDAKQQRNCIHKSDLKPALLSPGLIAGICIAVILVLSALVGCIVYRKWRNFPIARPFWTVELKDDHEGVNFSNIPEDEFTHREMEDLEFYKDQGGQRNKKGVQKYAPLHETA